MQSLKGLEGATLREAEVSKRGVALGFWTKGAAFWLWFEPNTWAPLLLPLNRSPEKSIKPARPLLLFLRAHFLGGRLKSVKRDESIGRMITLEFEGEKRIEIRLWPHGANLIVRSGESKVSWARIEDVQPAAQNLSGLAPRSWEEILNEWQSFRGGWIGTRLEKKETSREGTADLDSEKALQKERARLERAVRKVREEIVAKTKIPYRKIGEWLSEHQSLDVPTEYAPFVDGRRKFSWNLEQIFAKAKELERKMATTQQRLKKLEKDLAEIERVTDSKAWWEARANEKKDAPTRKNPKGNSNFRTVHLENGVRAFLGKSGQDNLTLLREARAWDFWLHLKDHPGSHAVLRRDKNQRVTDQDLRQVAIALVDQTFGAKSANHRGEKFELLVAECRFVRPIKGDRHGRVNYSHERVVPFQYQKPRLEF